jgi:hypothetical protein
VPMPSATENWKCFHVPVSGTEARNGLIAALLLRTLDRRHRS